MSNYVWNSQISFHDYLKEHRPAFNTTPSAYGGIMHSCLLAVPSLTRVVLVSDKALARLHIRLLAAAGGRPDAVPTALALTADRCEGGIDLLAYDIEGISAKRVTNLHPRFHWGFNEIIAKFGHMGDTHPSLVSSAKGPAHAISLNHFELARGAFRRRKFQDAVREVERAIRGDCTCHGFKSEWRSHLMLGVLSLGQFNGDLSLVDLARANEAFLQAAHYSEREYLQEAAVAWSAAGWTAYCQGEMERALSCVRRAIKLHPRMGEALFLAAKFKMALGQVDNGLSLLGKAIDIDPFFSLKAAGDGDFQRFDTGLRGFMVALGRKNFNRFVPLLRRALEAMGPWLDLAPAMKANKQVRLMEKFLADGSRLPLIDMFIEMQRLRGTIESITTRVSDSIFIVTNKGAGIPFVREESYEEERTALEEVVIRPRKFLRRAVTRLQATTHTVTQKRTMPVTLEGSRHDIYQGFGPRIASIEFCLIPAGALPEGTAMHDRITINYDFLMGKYPVTQAQWEAVMGSNPSAFKGPDRPVEGVSWHDCQAYIDKLNHNAGAERYRLPSEVEWEYSCRAGADSRFYYDDDKSRLPDYAWHASNAGQETHAVGQKKPNAWGVHDMHGNVWEWCQDWFAELPHDPLKTPPGPATEWDRVVRGGSWGSEPWRVATAGRGRRGPYSRSNRIGFRLAAVAAGG